MSTGRPEPPWTDPALGTASGRDPIRSSVRRRGTRGGSDRRGITGAPLVLPAAALLLGSLVLLLVLLGLVLAGEGGGSTAPSAQSSDGAPRVLSPSPSPFEPPSATATPPASTLPSASPDATAPPSPVVGASPSAAALDVAGTDAPDLPRPPGAVRIAFEGGIDGAVTWTLSRYRVAAALDSVRAHYRAAFVEHAWFVGDVAFEDEGWRFVASRGPREVAVELAPEGPGTLATVYLSDLVATPTRPPRTTAPDPTQPPRTSPPRTERPDRMPRPDPTERPRRTARPTQRPTPRPTQRPDRDDDDDRGDDDDDDRGGDDDDDDGGDDDDD